MDFETGHFSHRWHHHALGHQHPAGEVAQVGHERDDLGRMGVVLSAGRAAGGLAALAWTVYAARRLQGDWGQLSAVLAYASVASIGTDLGIPLALTRLACRHPTLDRAAVEAAIRRRAAAGTLAAGALILAWVNTKSGAGRWGLAAVYGISVTVTPVTSSYLALLRGRANAGIEAIYDVVRQVALPALGIAAIETGLGVFGVLGAYVAVDAASAAVIARLARGRLRFVPGPDAGEEDELRLRSTVPLSATTIVGSAYERVDSAMLAPLAGTAAIGIYRMISPIYGAVLMPARALGDTAAVGAGRGDGGASGTTRATVAPFALRAAVVTVPLAVLLAVVGPPLLPHVLGVKASVHNPHPINWSRAATPLRILMAATVPSAALAVLTPVAVMARRGRVFDLALGALGANIVMNLALVPHWAAGLGASGAALAFLITETALAAALWAGLPAKAVS
ncbi:MAG TPA: lipopolysaccharide biosynthesis protein [Acidimicrobiales bacterium]